MRSLLDKRDRVVAALTSLSALVAVAGCLLPWEQLRVSAAGEPAQTTRVGVLHGTGIAATAGSVLALLVMGHRLGRPGQSTARDVALAAAGTLLALGAALFTTSGGYRPVDAQDYSVTLGLGLILCALAGVALLALATLSVRAPGPQPRGQNGRRVRPRLTPRRALGSIGFGGGDSPRPDDDAGI